MRYGLIPIYVSVKITAQRVRISQGKGGVNQSQTETAMFLQRYSPGGAYHELNELALTSVSVYTVHHVYITMLTSFITF